MSEQQQGQKGVAGVGIIVAAYAGAETADQTLDAMRKAKQQKQFQFDDAAIIRQDIQGQIHIHETGDMGTGRGAGIGAIVGGVIGLLGGPAAVVLGAGVGAGIGAAAAHGDAGYRDENLKELGTALKPDTSAIVVITSHEFLKAVHDQVPEEEMAETTRKLAGEISDRLDEGKNVAIGILITEDGIGLKEVAVGDESAEMLGIVATEEGVAAVAAVATEEGVTYEAGVVTEEGAAYEAGAVTGEGAVIVDAVATPGDVGEEKAETDAPTAGDAPEKPQDKEDKSS